MAIKKRSLDFTALRLYTFVNFYLSSIQQGIQTAHVVSELFSINNLQNEQDLIEEWANHHKTIIVCNGGMGSDIVAGYDAINDERLHVSSKYPYAAFHEETKALGGESRRCVGVMTAFGIILPNTVYEAQPTYARLDRVRRTGAWEYGVRGAGYVKWPAGSPEAVICEYVSPKHLAR